MSNTINLGIDLGTTNSAIAMYQNGEVVVFKNPISLKETLPSVVALKGERTIVGEKAREMLQKSKGNVFGLFKRKMGTSEKFMTNEVDRMLTPIDLSSMVLKELKNFAPHDTNFDSVVITIPSAFDTVQSNATKKAGYAAGFQEVVLLQEPIAASLAYANKTNLDITEGQWLVYDLGGGTFDVALTKITDGELKIADHEGDNYLGGADFDRLIIDDFIVPHLKNKGSFNNLDKELKKASGKYNRLYYKLQFLAEEAKKELTNNTVTEIEFEVTDDNGNEIDFYEELSRETFEALIAPTINTTIRLTEEIFSRNDINPADLKCILLVGGSTYIPLVRSKLKEAFGVDIHTSLDPTTAVVMGAAYYAGLKPKKLSAPKTDINTSSKKGEHINFKIAFERVVRDPEAMLMVVTKELAPGTQYRIVRTDGGFDSGLVNLTSPLRLDLPLVADAHNSFHLFFQNEKGDKLHEEIIGITQGMFSIDGQPLPNNICLEVDSVEHKTTFLEPVFRKNDILPLQKVITKQVSETIYKGSDKRIIIKVYEGDIDGIPAANKLIGMIGVSGEELERDLIKGSDVELTLEITESRDLKVGAYFTLTDQEFEDTFSSSESGTTKQVLIEELNNFHINLDEKLKDLEKTGKYEEAARVVKIKEDIDSLKEAIAEIAEDQISDDLYKLEIQKREIGKRMQSVFNASILTKTIEEYYQQKTYTKHGLGDQLATDADRTEFENIIADERRFLQDGNITIIKMKINHLSGMNRRIASRKPTSVEDVKMYYLITKMQDYQDRQKADQLIVRGDKALQDNNIGELMVVLKELNNLKEQENRGGLFKNRGTGLK